MHSQPPDRFWVRLTLLCLSSLTVMTGATLSAALPAIRAAFKHTPNINFWVRLLLTTPALFIVISGPLAGLLVDRFGRKRPLLVGLMLYGLAGTSGLYLRSLAGLLIGRAVLGASLTVVYTAATALIADYYQGQARADFLGLQSGFMAASGVVFIFLGGILADFGWPYVFVMYAFSFVLLPFTLGFLFEPSVGVHQPMTETKIPRLFSTVPVLLLVFIYGLTLVGQIIFYTIPVQLPFHLQSMDISSASLSGLIIGFNSLLMAVSGVLYSRIKKRFSYQQVLLGMYFLFALGYLILGLASQMPVLLVGLAIAGLGLGLNNPNLTTWLVSIAPADLRGTALGIRLTFLFLGQFLSPILAQPLINRDGVPAAFLGAAMLSLLLLIVSLLMQKTSFDRQK